jgi:hypothetical protein
MNYLLVIPLLGIILCPSNSRAQPRTDAWLKDYLFQHASPVLTEVLNNPDTFRYQLIYTRIIARQA